MAHEQKSHYELLVDEWIWRRVFSITDSKAFLGALTGLILQKLGASDRYELKRIDDATDSVRGPGASGEVVVRLTQGDNKDNGDDRDKLTVVLIVNKSWTRANTIWTVRCNGTDVIVTDAESLQQVCDLFYQALQKELRS